MVKDIFIICANLIPTRQDNGLIQLVIHLN